MPDFMTGAAHSPDRGETPAPAESAVVDLMHALEQSMKAAKAARVERERAIGKCPLCGERFTDKGAMATLRAMVMLHEALTCPGVER